MTNIDIQSVVRDDSLDEKINRNCDFSLADHKAMSNPCTPPIGENEVNVLRINLPETVYFNADPDEVKYLDMRHLTLTLCGNCAFSAGILGIEGHLTDAMMYTAVDANDSATYTGKFPTLGIPIPKPTELESQDPLPPDLIVGEPFNPNLAEVFQLAAKETEYYIHVTLGPYKSNVLKVQVKQKRD